MFSYQLFSERFAATTMLSVPQTASGGIYLNLLYTRPASGGIYLNSFDCSVDIPIFGVVWDSLSGLCACMVPSTVRLWFKIIAHRCYFNKPNEVNNAINVNMN